LELQGDVADFPFLLAHQRGDFFASLRLQGERNQRQGYAGDDVSRA
jgi:hypothetical protein